ncbi:MAG: hypothetical protein A2Y12_19575 [Planctomycetes bacterium GWF2_42_9]|nr:MAG: hypothetical protein A2Y12_19575 [Planctomycetes bacterium GWF2_42_9]
MNIKYACILIFLFESFGLGASIIKSDTSIKDKLIPYTIKTDLPVGAIIICPGGSYSGHAQHEAEVIAKFFNNAGLNAFVLYYTTGTKCYPKPLQELGETVRYVRSQSGKWNIKSDKIAVCGFSAGGHLAASLGCFFEDSLLQMNDVNSCRPDALILCYPVISSGQFGHKYSFDTLLGPGHSKELEEKMSLENHVHNKFPPVFIWHTMEDETVPVENSILFALALKKNEIPFEMQIYPHGKHGLGLAKENELVSQWTESCLKWLEINQFKN